MYTYRNFAGNGYVEWDVKTSRRFGFGRGLACDMFETAVPNMILQLFPTHPTSIHNISCVANTMQRNF